MYLLQRAPSSDPSLQSTALLHLDVALMHSMPLEHAHVLAEQVRAMFTRIFMKINSTKLRADAEFMNSPVLIAQKAYFCFILNLSIS